MNKNKSILLLILLIATLLRLWKLGSIPPHLTPDEAALGYNAYSILMTGKDEYGNVLPLIFKSFGDYKPGLYVYAAIPFIKVLGLSEFAVRLPSAIAGIFGIYIFYLIIKTALKNEKIALFGSFLLSVSPWHIHFSRGAWEINLNGTILLIAVYFFLLSLNKSKYLVYSSIAFALTLFTYQGAKISTPIAITSLLIAYFQKIKGISRKNIFISLIVGMAVSLPIIFSIFTGQAGRANVFSVFSYPRPKEYLENFLSQGNEEVNAVSYYLFHSESLNFIRGILGRWFNHFSARFLFFEGDWQNPRHSAPYSGMLIHLDIILLIAGLYALFRLKDKNIKFFILMWLFLSPLGSAITRDQVHAVRAFNMVYPMTFILALGLGVIFSTKWKILTILLSLLYIINYTYFLDSYFVHLPIHNSKLWSYGYKQLVNEITPLKGNYKKIIIPQSYAQPYIFYLFYEKYDPGTYQLKASLVNNLKDDVGLVERIDNIHFKFIDFPQDIREKGIILVADDIQAPKEEILKCTNCKIIKEIPYLNNKETAFRVIEVK